MDILAEVLDRVRLGGTLLFHYELGHPWSLALPARPHAVFHYLSRGSATLALEQGRELGHRTRGATGTSPAISVVVDAERCGEAQERLDREKRLLTEPWRFWSREPTEDTPPLQARISGRKVDILREGRHRQKLALSGRRSFFPSRRRI